MMSDKTKKIVAIIVVILVFTLTAVVSLNLPISEEKAEKSATEFFDALHNGDVKRAKQYLHPNHAMIDDLSIRPDADSVVFLNYYQAGIKSSNENFKQNCLYIRFKSGGHEYFGLIAFKKNLAGFGISDFIYSSEDFFINQ